MNKKTFIILFISLTLKVSAKGYLKLDNFNSGKILFEITYLDEGMDEQRRAMMPDESTFYFKGDKNRIDIKTAMGTTSIISDLSTKKGIMLMEFMGNKFAMNFDPEESKKENKVSTEVQLLDGEKTIAGYHCKKAQITQTNKGDKLTYEVWYTNEILTNNAYSNGIEGINGCMLQYEILQNGIHMKMTARKVSEESLNDELFSVPEGFTMTTQEELKTMMMGGKRK